MRVFLIALVSGLLSSVIYQMGYVMGKKQGIYLGCIVVKPHQERAYSYEERFCRFKAGLND